jgi:RNA polymerase sigma factor (sigma-70 family)
MSQAGSAKDTAVDAVGLTDRRDLVRFIVSRLRCRATAEDLVQEAYIRLLEVSRPLRSPRAFLFRTVANLALNHRRDESRRAELRRDVLEPHAEVADLSTPEHTAVAVGELGVLAEAFAALPPRTREVFMLNRFEGLNQREVAERLGISLTVVEKHMSRAVLHLTGALGTRRDE